MSLYTPYCIYFLSVLSATHFPSYHTCIAALTTLFLLLPARLACCCLLHLFCCGCSIFAHYAVHWFYGHRGEKCSRRGLPPTTLQQAIYLPTFENAAATTLVTNVVDMWQLNYRPVARRVLRRMRRAATWEERCERSGHEDIHRVIFKPPRRKETAPLPPYRGDLPRLIWNRTLFISRSRRWIFQSR